MLKLNFIDIHADQDLNAFPSLSVTGQWNQNLDVVNFRCYLRSLHTNVNIYTIPCKSCEVSGP